MSIFRHVIAPVVAVAVLAVVGYRVAGPGAESGANGGGGGKAAGKNAGQGVPVRLAPVMIKDVARRIELAGRTEADATVTLKPRVDGQVMSMPLAEGQAVRQGDLLIQLDPADFEARLAQARANHARSKAQAAKSRADLARYLALRDKGFVSDEKVAEIRTAAEAADSTAAADAAAVELARLQLSYTAIRAPFAGVVGARLVFPGATVKTNDTALAVINRVQPLKVAFAVPEKYLPQVRAQLGGGGKTMRASVARADGGSLAATVNFVDNSVDAASGTIQLKATLPNADRALTAGQFVSVGLVLDTLREIATIPAEAVQQGSEGSFVFLAREGKVAMRKVTVDAVQDGIAAIGAGLAAGDMVVTEGHPRLTDGARYRIPGIDEKSAAKGGGKPSPETPVKPATPSAAAPTGPAS